MTELDPVRKLIRERVPNLKEMSLALGRSHSFLHQFLTRGTPVKLPEDVRKLLAEKLSVSEDLLRGGSAAVLVTPRKTSSRKAKQMPPESLLSYEMWSIWDQANSEQRKLIVGIANMVLKTGKAG
jgi:hypothetical protein